MRWFERTAVFGLVLVLLPMSEVVPARADDGAGPERTRLIVLTDIGSLKGCTKSQIGPRIPV